MPTDINHKDSAQVGRMEQMDTDERECEVRLSGRNKASSECEDRVWTSVVTLRGAWACPPRVLAFLITAVSQRHQVNTWTWPGRERKTELYDGRRVFFKPLAWPLTSNQNFCSFGSVVLMCFVSRRRALVDRTPLCPTSLKGDVGPAFFLFCSIQTSALSDA